MQEKGELTKLVVKAEATKLPKHSTIIAKIVSEIIGKVKVRINSPRVIKGVRGLLEESRSRSGNNTKVEDREAITQAVG